MYIKIIFVGVLVISMLLNACGGNGGTKVDPVVSVPSPSPSPSPEPVSIDKIKLNQLGYTLSAQKIAVVPSVNTTQFSVVSASTGSVVLSDNLGPAASWPPAGSEPVRTADFSALTTAGEYRIRVDGLNDSSVFTVNDNVYNAVHSAALKAFYFNRSSSALEETHAGIYARALGHADTNVHVFADAATASRPEGTSLSASKGWYDAGDYGKYVVNSGIATYTLMAAYERFSAFYEAIDINIPESGDDAPDILDEVMWNLEWLESMQDLDGGVYHKLTTLGFSGSVMPSATNNQRYFIGKTTTASLDFSALMSVASRIFANLENEFPGKAVAYEQAARDAYSWALNNPDVTYSQDSRVSTGTYSDQSVNDEFMWAAAELYILTGESGFWDDFQNRAGSDAAGIASWPNVRALGYISLSNHAESLLDVTDFQAVQDAITDTADIEVSNHQSSAYRVGMLANDFTWGSNANALNKAMILMEANAIKASSDYVNAAQSLLDYVLGRNPTDYSYVTGFGELSPMNIHHRPSLADGIAEPIPGFVAGGAQPGQQDNCDYPSDLAARSYIDDYCSYSTNEIAINWNAPLVYVLAAIMNN
ncbi:MAG: endoglucanase [Flavobacteriales bacterium]|jgi:endoglucanase